MTAHTHDPASLASRPGLAHLQEDHQTPVDRGSVAYLVELHQALHAEQATPPARPVLTPFDLEAIIDGLSTLTGIYADRGQPWQSTARLQGRLIAAQPYLAQVLAGLAPAATMTEAPLPHSAQWIAEASGLTTTHPTMPWPRPWLNEEA